MDARTSGSVGTTVTWLSEPDMVVLSSDRGTDVVIAVVRASRNTLTVSNGSTSAILTVTAVQEAGAWRVELAR